jgi:uncharacterized repeat protein (TIGR01451 family)
MRRDLKRHIFVSGVFLLALACGLLAPSPVLAAMWGYMTNPNGIYRVNTATGAATLQYGGAPFNGATIVAGAGQRPSDGMVFFTYNNTANQPVYRWDPATPAVAPVLLGNTGGGVPYLHRLAFHPTSGVLYAFDINGTRIWSINQATGAATAVANIGNIPANLSGDIAFDPTTNNLYLVTFRAGNKEIWQLPLVNGNATFIGNITGGVNGGNAVTSVMFNAAGTLFFAGSLPAGGPFNLYTAPITGGPAVIIGALGALTQDFGSVPAPPPTIAKSFTPAAVIPNSNSVLTLTLTNTYTQPMRGAAITDTYPAGVVNAPVPGGATTCGGVVTAAAGGNTVALTGGTIPASGSCTVTVNVRSAAVGVYNNGIAAGALSTILGFNDNAPTATLTVALPNLTVVKASSVYSDPFNGTTNPKAIPGSLVNYMVTVSNTGAGPVDNNTVIIIDAIPANTDLYVNDIGAAGSGPVAFLDGAPSSGLTYTFTSLANAADDVSFSNDGGATYTYVPTPNGNGVDPAVTHIRINPKSIFLGNSGFQITFRVRTE